jgi:ATP synthase F0 subunit b
MVATLATTAVLLAAASVALAAEAGHSSVNWKAEAWKVVNFLIVVGVLWWLLKDRLPAFLGERRNKIDRAIEEAKAAKAEAEAKRTEYEAKIARAEQEIAEIDAEGVRRAEALREDLAKATEEAAEKLAADAKERVEAEVKGARAELQREASLLAVELSEELIRERIAEEDQRKLVDETIQKLEGLK